MTSPDAPSLLASYHDDPLAFARDCFDWPPGEALAPYQAEILGALPRARRVAVRGPHGLGKTALAAVSILWFAATRDAAGEDWKCPTTASAWRQLTEFLWPEVHKWARRLNGRFWRAFRPEGLAGFDPRRELLGLSLNLQYGSAFALASGDPAMIEGAHAAQLLYVFDEAKSIRDETFDAAEGALAAGNALALMVSTPGEPLGRFYDVHARKAGTEDWLVRRVSKAECIAAGRVSSEWAEQRKLQWGAQSGVYLNRVEGEFASSDEDGVIPLAWVEAANERWREWKARPRQAKLAQVGVDVAWSGSDMTVLAPRWDEVYEEQSWRIISELNRRAAGDTMSTVGAIISLLKDDAKAVVDVAGAGAAIVDRLREQGKAVDAFNGGHVVPWLRDGSREMEFLNARAASYWRLREMLDPENDDVIVALPPDDLLTGDLVTPKWRLTSAGKIQVEGKDEIRKRIGRSTDSGDAVVYAMWPTRRIPLGPVPYIMGPRPSATQSFHERLEARRRRR